jgi:hypothetical protein
VDFHWPKETAAVPHRQTESRAIRLDENSKVRFIREMKNTFLGKMISCLLPLSLVFLVMPVRAETLDGFMRDGRINEGLAAFASPTNNSERFSLAVLQTLDGLQQFSAGIYHLGIKPDFAQSDIPFFRVVPTNHGQASNEIATPEKVSELFNNLRASLKRANSTLAGMSDEEFKVEVNLSQARLDFDGDGIVSSNELLVDTLGRVLGVPARTQAGGDLIIHFDSADAMWLKGYTHFLTGIIDMILAYDWLPVWNQCAHQVFQHPDPMPPIASFSAVSQGGEFDEEFAQWADFIAAVHDMRLELRDKNGLSEARDEFRSMISCSRVCWKRVLAETDDDHEWLPSPNQTGPGGAKVTQKQIDGWMHILDELDDILAGKKLLPHWRIKDGTGINVDKLVASPPPLDLVLMIQGSAFIPYLEEGPVSDQTTWRTLSEPFGPGFMRFAIWSQ